MLATAAATDDILTPTERLAPSRRLVELLLIVAVFFIAAGDPPPHVNESHYLCRLKHFWNPSWCAGDLFLESTDTQVVFIWLFGWVTRWVSLTATAWIGRVLTWTFIAWAWQRLSWRLVPRPLASVLSAALFVTLNTYCHLAGEWVVGGVEAKCFAFAFVLLALGELLDGRWNFVWLLLGAATAFHPLVGGWSGVVCVGLWLLDRIKSENGPASFFSMVPGLVGGGLLGMLGILPALSLTWHEPPDVVAEAGRIYVFDRLPHHLAPLTLPSDEIIRRFGGHILLLLTLMGLARVNKAPPPCPLPKGKSVDLAGLRRITWFAWSAVLLACVGLAIELVFWNRPLIAARLLRYYWFRLTDFAAAMAVAFQWTALIAAGLARRRAWGVRVLVMALALCGMFLVSAAWPRLAPLVSGEPALSPADRKAVDNAAWVEVCDWIAENTPPDALFLTPRLNLTFKWRTGRPEVANRKDIPQDARGIVEWNRRLKDIYYTEYGGLPQPLDSIGALGTDKVRDLAERYGAKYVLMDRGQLLELPIAFQNREYIVYVIKDRKPGDGR